jgi:hypothetical protein
MDMMKCKLVALFLAVLLGSSISMMPLSAANNNSTDVFKKTEIQVQSHFEKFITINDDLYLPENACMAIMPMVFVDGDLKRFRKIHFTIRDSNGNLRYEDKLFSNKPIQYNPQHGAVYGNGIPVLDRGDYIMVFSYAGNKKDKLLPCNKTIQLHIY